MTEGFLSGAYESGEGVLGMAEALAERGGDVIESLGFPRELSLIVLGGMSVLVGKPVAFATLAGILNVISIVGRGIGEMGQKIWDRPLFSLGKPAAPAEGGGATGAPKGPPAPGAKAG